MFTGIIECLGKVTDLKKENGNLDLWVTTPVTHELKIDQSVAHNGVCLTVVEIKGDKYRVTAVEETLMKTNLSSLSVGDSVNIERAMKVGDRLDGHFVQGHVDAVATCILNEEKEGSWLYRFEFPKRYAALVIEKGSICINGVSLTAFDIAENQLTVTIIPYTYEHTCFKYLQENDVVNFEFDVLGKYMLRQQEVK